MKWYNEWLSTYTKHVCFVYIVTGSDETENLYTTSVTGTGVDIPSPKAIDTASNFDGKEFHSARPSHPSTSRVVTPETIRPHPKACPRKTSAASNGRKRSDAKIPTDTPVKRLLEADAKHQEAKKLKSAVHTSSPYKHQLIEKSKSKKPLVAKTSRSKSKAKTGQQRQKTPKRQKEKVTLNGDDTPCIMCKKRYNEAPFEDWAACSSCHGWYHESCGPDDVAMCYNCVN